MNGISVNIDVPSGAPTLGHRCAGKNLARHPGPVTHAPGQGLGEKLLPGLHRVRNEGLHRLGQEQERSVQPDVLAHRHLKAAGVTWGYGQEEKCWNRQRRLLEDVRIFCSLSSDERDQLAGEMTHVDYQADEVILASGEVADRLMIISAGVVSVAIHDDEKLVEAGRLGPGEVMGEEGIPADRHSGESFAASPAVACSALKEPCSVISLSNWANEKRLEPPGRPARGNSRNLGAPGHAQPDDQRTRSLERHDRWLSRGFHPQAVQRGGAGMGECQRLWARFYSQLSEHLFTPF